MKYNISAEEFLKQDEKVQKVFLDWWKPEIGDVFSTKKVYDEIDVVIDVVGDKIWGLNITFKCCKDKKVCPYIELCEVFPLFNLQQLIDFVEDKTKGKVDLNYSYFDKGYDVFAYNDGAKFEDFKCTFKVNTEEGNLLKAIWEVACRVATKVAKEETNETNNAHTEKE